jgi:phosphoribosylformimino-5-aminoimidazole carboxamide ribotide isomerase
LIVIPAIDIKGGRCVRLFQGKMDRETVYSDNPVESALRWKEAGARYLHVVDLDGAVQGRPVHPEIIGRICLETGLPVQVGGGIRQISDIEIYFGMGVERVVLGSSVIQDTALAGQAAHLFPGKIAAGIDAAEGWVAVRGWAEVTQVRALDLVKKIDTMGFGAFIFTDIQRDGTLRGPNMEALKEICLGSRTPVIASGGISTLQDIRNLRSLEKDGLTGVIVGKALYAGTVHLPEAILAAEENVG